MQWLNVMWQVRFVSKFVSLLLIKSTMLFPLSRRGNVEIPVSLYSLVIVSLETIVTQGHGIFNSRFNSRISIHLSSWFLLRQASSPIQGKDLMRWTRILPRGQISQKKNLHFDTVGAEDLCQGNDFIGRDHLFVVHQMHKGWSETERLRWIKKATRKGRRWWEKRETNETGKGTMIDMLKNTGYEPFPSHAIRSLGW